MGFFIACIVGALFIILPNFFSPILANIIYQLTRHAPGGIFTKSAEEIYSEASDDQMKVRPLFTVCIGILIIIVTVLLHMLYK